MTYARNAWYVAAWTHEILPEKPFAMTILDERIVIYRTASGRLVALEDRCVHRLAPLSLGRCEGDQLRCMYHGLLYDPDGKVAKIPGQELVPQQARVRSFPVADRHSWIWVWMGEPQLADEALIPTATGLDHPDYILGHGTVDYAAEAQLVNDNLLDFSHLPYVHANSFGSGSEHAESVPLLIALERGMRFERWSTNVGQVFNRPLDEPVDIFMTYDFLVPGVLLLWAGHFAAGTAAACGFARPDYKEATSGVSFSGQAVTPMGARSARYFFSIGPHRHSGNEALRDFMLDVAIRAFDEDKVMIEAQQRVINDTADPRAMPTAHDRGLAMFNGIVRKLVAADKEIGRQVA